MASVSLQGVRKSFGAGHPVLHGLDLEVENGSFVVLVGPSGCGKTTILRIVAGLEEVEAGTVRIGDRVVNDVPPRDRDVAMVFQSYALYPHMTVAHNMGFGLRMRRVPKVEIERRVRAAADLLGLVPLLGRRPHQLSGGQQQRVALGRAIVREPSVFLFDEPLSNLDARLRTTTRAELRSLHHRLRTTSFYVTHDQEEAMTLGDRVVVMDRGVVQQSGAPLELYEHPVNRFVGGFIGSPPMNMLRVGLEHGADATTALLRAADGTTQRLALDGVGALAARRLGWKEAVLGIRPEHLAEANPGDATARDGAPRLDAAVRVVEMLGDRMDVLTDPPAPTFDKRPHLVARLPARRGVTPGDRLRLLVDSARIVLFNTGERGEAAR